MRIPLLVLAAVLAGCSEQTTSDIFITDRGVFLPELRAVFDISPQSAAPARPHDGHAVEFSYTGGSGKDTQVIPSGERPVVFGGQLFSAPQDLRHEYDWRYASLNYRFRKFFGQTKEFGIEALGGLGWAELDLTVSSPALSAHERINNGGLTGGFGVIWNFRPTTSLQSRFTLFGPGGEEKVSGASRIDAYLVQTLGSNAALRAGWAGWNVRSNRDSFEASQSLKSPIRANFNGPALSLEVAF